MIVVIDQEVSMYDNPSKTVLRTLKEQAEAQGKSFKCFCFGGKDGVIVSPNNAEPKYFASEREADRYARKFKQCDVYYCQQVQV